MSRTSRATSAHFRIRSTTAVTALTIASRAPGTVAAAPATALANRAADVAVRAELDATSRAMSFKSPSTAFVASRARK